MLVLLWVFSWPLHGVAQNAPTPTSEVNAFLPPGMEDQGWPFVRGSKFDGHSPEIHIADNWPETGPPVLWTRELGQGYSAFVAHGKRVYTQGQSLGGQYVYCLDADTGDTIWERRYDWPYEGLGVYPGPRATPTLSGGRLFLAAPSGTIECLNADTGKQIWTRNVIEEFKGRGGIDFGYSCSPTVVEDLVILPVGGELASLVALNAEDGTVVWAAGSDPASYASALPIARAGRQLVVGYLENSLVIHDLHTGVQLVHHNLSHGYDEHSAWPIYREPNLWLAAPFRAGSQLLEVPERFDGDQELRTVWSSRILSNDVVSSVLVDGHIYGFDIFDVQVKTQRPSRGQFRCVEFLTGAERWSQGTNRLVREDDDRDPATIGQAGIVAVDGKLILLNELGELILLRATPEKCEELARTSVLGGELTWTPPILHRGRIYVRNHARAVCIYVGEPELLIATLPTLSVTDIPQSRYRDLAATILAIEPEYVFDVPSQRWLWIWYLASIAILAASGLVALSASYCVPAARRGVTRRWVYRGSAFLAGAVGTTALSAASGDFVFTWPICLFVAFEPVVASIRQRKSPNVSPAHRWIERLALLVFLGVCLAYFALCRRLSLVFEWSFLVGFVGAVPFLGFKKWMWNLGRWEPTTNALLTGLAFTAFYACGALPLLLKQ